LRPHVRTPAHRRGHDKGATAAKGGEVRTREGEVLKSVAVFDPGTEEVATVAASELPRYCKFDVKGGRANFRASILVRQAGSGSISALPAE
jgi:hypothetical protein